MKTKLIPLISIILGCLFPSTGFARVYDTLTPQSHFAALKSEIASLMMGPGMGLTSTYALFSSNGSVSNSGITLITGDIGVNVGQTTGFDPLKVTGMIHLTSDMATKLCSRNLLTLYNYLDQLPVNFELPNPTKVGYNMILTPQTYHLNAATMLTDTLYMNALDDPNAIFCVQINGALTTAANSRIILMNGAQSKNIFWKIDGAVMLSDHSIFRGIIVSNHGTISMKTGVMLDGAAFTTAGAITLTASTVIMPYAGIQTAIEQTDASNPEIELIVAPNLFGSSTTINLKNDSKYLNCNFEIYNIMGVELMSSIVTKQTITLDTSHLHGGVYFYKLMDKNKIIQSGKLISQN